MFLYMCMFVMFAHTHMCINMYMCMSHRLLALLEQTAAIYVPDTTAAIYIPDIITHALVH